MLKVKTLVPLFLLALAAPSVALAGLDIFPADGPAPKIVIEQPKPVTYMVKRGDTIAVIAKKFSVDAKKLMAANGLRDPRKLRAGKALTIPGTKAKAAVKPAGVAAAAKTATAPKAVQGAVTAQAIGRAHVAEEKADAKARRARRKGAVLAPGVVEEAPVTRRRGKKGKRLAAVAPPSVTIDARTRASFGKTGVVMNNSSVPQAIRDEFYRYAVKWVDDLETIGVGTFHSKKIRRVGNDWVATYRVILRGSLGAEVKKVDYVHTPYVGHITYVQRVFTCHGPTKQSALQGPYTSKDEHIREIFSYSGRKKAWR